MGKEILKIAPRAEWVYLVNPSLARVGDKVVEEHIVNDGVIFSKPFREWLLEQEMGRLYLLTEHQFTQEEAGCRKGVWNKQGGKS